MMNQYLYNTPQDWFYDNLENVEALCDYHYPWKIWGNPLKHGFERIRMADDKPDAVIHGVSNPTLPEADEGW